MDVTLQCRCGEVRGRLREASPKHVNRAVCYCADCQAFAHHLGRADLLDAHGGSDIVQVAPARLSFNQGDARIACLRLSPKGLLRHYASCCNTPLGNTVTPAFPFVGILASAFATPEADEAFGKPWGAFNTKSAVGERPAEAGPLILLRAMKNIIGWRLRGQSWPHPFFDPATKKPSRPITVLSKDERQALRALCGPRP